MVRHNNKQIKVDMAAYEWQWHPVSKRVNKPANDDDNLIITGRKNNVINFVGMKVFPEEVESVINQHPQVSESLVYGEKHSRYGYLPVAQVVAKEGEGDKLDVNNLRGYCYRRLAQYKTPKSFVQVDKIPKTRSGKIIRR